mmetsp:Transcript_7124/g.20078  ORF Transcript_7124/g.20078 Transcript_7124/m.20078 type:complete len:522 (+) Transcript_7124:451-2016(+)
MYLQHHANLWRPPPRAHEGGGGGQRLPGGEGDAVRETHEEFSHAPCSRYKGSLPDHGRGRWAAPGEGGPERAHGGLHLAHPVRPDGQVGPDGQGLFREEARRRVAPAPGRVRRGRRLVVLRPHRRRGLRAGAGAAAGLRLRRLFRLLPVCGERVCLLHSLPERLRRRERAHAAPVDQRGPRRGRAEPLPIFPAPDGRASRGHLRVHGRLLDQQPQEVCEDVQGVETADCQGVQVQARQPPRGPHPRRFALGESEGGRDKVQVQRADGHLQPAGEEGVEGPGADRRDHLGQHHRRREPAAAGGQATAGAPLHAVQQGAHDRRELGAVVGGAGRHHVPVLSGEVVPHDDGPVAAQSGRRGGAGHDHRGPARAIPHHARSQRFPGHPAGQHGGHGQRRRAHRLAGRPRGALRHHRRGRLLVGGVSRLRDGHYDLRGAGAAQSHHPDLYRQLGRHVRSRQVRSALFRHQPHRPRPAGHLRPDTRQGGIQARVRKDAAGGFALWMPREEDLSHGDRAGPQRALQPG